MFRDHYVVAASPVKAFADGQIVPLSSVSSSPDFLGWMTRRAAAGLGAGRRRAQRSRPLASASSPARSSNY